LSDDAGDEAADGEDPGSSLEAAEAVESAKAGDAIDTAKARTAQSMRLIEVMGAEARKWKRGRNQKNRSKAGQGLSRLHDAHMQHVAAGGFYRVRVLAAGSMDTIDKHRSHRHVMVPSALYSRLDSPG
jgi:hypothetical protein